MLQGIRQNYHHSKLPKVGEIVVIAGLRGNPLNGQKCIVSHYPLTDNWQWYGKNDPNRPGRGIHTAYVRVLATGEITRVAGQWLVSPDDWDREMFHGHARRLGFYDRDPYARKR